MKVSALTDQYLISPVLQRFFSLRGKQAPFSGHSADAVVPEI
jgi:hypothetical protein